MDTMKVNLPPGKSGPWEIRPFEITEKDAKHERAMAAIRGERRYVPAGKYTGLFRHGEVIMSDTPDEMRDHREAIRQAKGHCLVMGLGIGMVVKAMLEKPEVTKVTVIEKSEDVIKLTGPTLQKTYGDRFEVIQADAIDFKPMKGVRYGVVWADSLRSSTRPHISCWSRCPVTPTTPVGYSTVPNGSKRHG